MNKKTEQQKPLTMALRFINEKLHVKDTYLEAAYFLSRRTLCRIRNAEDTPRAYEEYMRVFVTILNKCRKEREIEARDKNRPLKAERSEKMANEITCLMRDVLLAEYAVRT